MKKIYFYGIGGVSMSALAKLCLSLGYEVFGSDDNDSENLHELKKLGVRVSLPCDKNAINECDYFVYTIAVGQNSNVVRYALDLGKIVYERAEFLGLIAKNYQKVVAIAGTHGKTTSTALIGEVFKIAGKKPTVHIGGDALNLGGNLLIGKREFFITEACEFNRSFLHLQPTCALILNIERDHMDTYKDELDLQNTFAQFAKNSTEVVILNGDQINLKNYKNCKKIITFGFNKNNDYCAKNIRSRKGKFSFDCYYLSEFIGRVKLNILGRHNILNALGCIAVARYYNIDFCDIVAGISAFSGVNRRLSLLKQVNNITHYHDYAHHPTEIKTTLETLKLLKPKRLIALFQPHTYSRTLALMNEFCSSFDCVNFLYILPTYPAREEYKFGGDALDLFYNLNGSVNCAYYSNFYSLAYELDNSLRAGDCVVWLGAGDIDKIAEKYLENRKKA